jgi:hypothetical protein
MTWVLLVTACGPPPSTPPPPEPEVREIEEQKASPDADRVGPLGIPEGQLPSPGECRIWYPQRTASQQPAAQGCVEAEASATPGTWVLYRPPDDARVVHVRVMHPEKAGVVIRINIFDAEKGTYLGTKEVSEGPP